MDKGGRTIIFAAAVLAIAGSLLSIPQANALDPYVVMDQVNRLTARPLWPGFELPLIAIIQFFTLGGEWDLRLFLLP